MAKVEFEEVGKIYPDGTRAVDQLNLDIDDGEFLVLVGPSGCGKTTALRMAAGLEDVSEGALRIGGRVVNHVPARDRDVAMVFQSYALYPHLDVFDNIAFGLRLRKVADPRDHPTRQPHRGHARPHRAPAPAAQGPLRRPAPAGRDGPGDRTEPSVFLMDEPLSNLDAKLRVQMRAEIARNSRRLGVTTIYVTHDQTEAMTLGHRVAVMKKGVLQQVAVPQELYDRPANLFVAGFIGSPAMNMLKGTLIQAETGPVLALGDQHLLLRREILATRPELRSHLGRDLAVGIRPEDMAPASPGQDAGTTLDVTAELTEALGSDLLVHCGVDIEPVDTEDTKELARDAGSDEETPVATRFLDHSCRPVQSARPDR